MIVVEKFNAFHLANLSTINLQGPAYLRQG